MGHQSVSNTCYDPLPVGVDAIRILNIEPGGFSDPLICTLTPVAFSAKPKYVALSYTWGDPYRDNVTVPTSPQDVTPPSLHGILLGHGKTWPSPSMARHGHSKSEQSAAALPTTSSPHSSFKHDPESPSPPTGSTQDGKNVSTITLNGSPFAVGHNLCLALLHLRSLTEPLSLWVDAICINQSDHAERNAQVASMSFIYTRAAAVVAWLGVREFKSGSQLVDSSSSFRSMAAEWKAGQVQHFAAAVAGRRRFRFSLEPDQPAVLARIAESAYWTRLWVVQELCLSRLLFIVYGSDIWPYEDFLRWGALQRVKERHCSPGFAAHGVAHGGVEAMLRLLQARDAKYTDAMTLENLLEVFRLSLCIDLKDRVYGLVGLANDVRPVPKLDSASVDSLGETLDGLQLRPEDGPKPRGGTGSLLVDYDLTFYHLWVNVVKFVYFEAKLADSKFASQKADPDSIHVPGVDSLSKEERRITLVRTAGIIQEALGNRVEDELAQLNPQAQTRDQTVIRAMGYLSGEIVQLGPDYESLVASVRAQYDWISCWHTHYQTPADLVTLRKLNEEYMAKIIAFEPRDLDRVRGIHDPNSVAWRAALGGKPTAADASTTVQGYSRMWDEEDDDKKGPARPRVCIGTEHLIAMVPPTARAGDFIVRFWNCDAAVVMRPFDPGDASEVSASSPSMFLLVGRTDVVEVGDRKATPGRDEYAERALCEIESTSLDDSRAVYVDLPVSTLQIITASINA